MRNFDPEEKTYFLIAFGLMFLLLVYKAVDPFGADMSLSKNQLALGDSARVSGTVNVPLFAPVELSGLDRKRILELRSEIANKTPDLLAAEYNPSGEVFGLMQSGLQWFSVRGYFYYGRGMKNQIGPSAESRNVMNPFLLASPEFWGMSIWTPTGVRWNKKYITKEQLQSVEFPYYVRPNALNWTPKEKRAEVTYFVTDYIDRANQYVRKSLSHEAIDFGLSAYNARDLGLKFMAVNMAASSNLRSIDLGDTPIEIRDHVTAMKNLCAKGLTCNTSDLPMLEVDEIIAEHLPASVSINFWREKPESGQTAPDLTFKINLI